MGPELTPRAAFRAPRRIAGHGRWVVYPSPAVTAADCAAWNIRNPGRRISPGEHMTLCEVDGDGEQTVYMSDAEWADHRRVLAVARGQVVVTGLGLGCIVRAMFARGRVRHITVVERDADVIALVWPELSRAHGGRLALHHADAVTGPMPAGRWDLAWHDIWPSTSVMNIREMLLLRDRYRRAARRQLCWAEGLCWRQLGDYARRHTVEMLETRATQLGGRRP